MHHHEKFTLYFSLKPLLSKPLNLSNIQKKKIRIVTFDFMVIVSYK